MTNDERKIAEAVIDLVRTLRVSEQLEEMSGDTRRAAIMKIADRISKEHGVKADDVIKRAYELMSGETAPTAPRMG